MKTDEKFRVAKNVWETNSRLHWSLEQIHTAITKSEKLKEKTETVRSIPDKKTRQNVKCNLLPTVEFNSVCEGVRNGQNVVEMTGYMIMDIDDLQDVEEAQLLSDTLFNAQGLGVKMSFVSPSGNGVKVLIRVPELTKDNFKDCWKMVDHYIYNICHRHCDTQTNDIVRLTYFAHDGNAHYRDGDTQFCVTLEQFRNMWTDDDKMKVVGKKHNTTQRELPPLTDEYAKNLTGLAREFGDWCDQNRLCLFPCTSKSHDNGYNLWIGFGAQLYVLFGGSKEGLEIFKKCSRHTFGYSESDTENKWNVLPTEHTDIRNLIGTLYNAAIASKQPKLKTWLDNAKTRHKIGESGTRMEVIS